MVQSIFLFLLQVPDFKNYEDLGLKSILISIIVMLIMVIVYLYKKNEKDLKEKDAKIMAVIEEHKADLREAGDDYKALLERYHQFTNQLMSIVDARKS